MGLLETFIELYVLELIELNLIRELLLQNLILSGQLVKHCLKPIQLTTQHQYSSVLILALSAIHDLAARPVDLHNLHLLVSGLGCQLVFGHGVEFELEAFKGVQKVFVFLVFLVYKLFKLFELFTHDFGSFVDLDLQFLFKTMVFMLIFFQLCYFSLQFMHFFLLLPHFTYHLVNLMLLLLDFLLKEIIFSRQLF